MTTVNPYLTFNGNCEEAFNFYRSVFGGEFHRVVRFKDVPSEQPMPENDSERIMHVSLPIGEGTMLMASDRPEEFGDVAAGSNFSISVSAESKEGATALFDGLSAGGRITMPLKRTFWNAYFGMLVDRFGIQWMVSYDYGQQA